MRSTLVRSLLIDELFPLVQRKPIKETFPLDERQNIDVPAMLSVIIKHWDRELLCNSADFTRKSSRALGVYGTYAPKEDVYQVEIVFALKAWFPENYELFTQVTVPQAGKRKNMSADILMKKYDEKILFELVAHTGRSEVEEHIDRVKEYAEVLGATSSYVLHFTTSPKIEEYPFSSESDQVQVLHVQHSLSFDSIKLYHRKGEDPIWL